MSTSTPTKISADQLLRDASLRRTPVRVALLNLLHLARQPLAVPEMLQLLPPPIDTVTVYRTLNTFTESQLVHRVRSEDRSWRYAIGPSQARHTHRHPHFVCERCGLVECLANSKIPTSLVRALHVARNYRVKFPEVLLHGLCPKCG